MRRLDTKNKYVCQIINMLRLLCFQWCLFKARAWIIKYLNYPILEVPVFVSPLFGVGFLSMIYLCLKRKSEFPITQITDDNKIQ